MIIDCHTHIVPPAIRENRIRYVEEDPCFAMIFSDRRAKMATAEELIASMDESGIDVSVVLNYGWTTHDLCVQVNDYILESVAKYPRRLVGFCSVQPNSTEKTIVTEIERCVRGGAKGIGELRPDMQLFDLRDDTVMAPLIEMLKKYKLILHLHASEPVGHSYPGKGSVTPGILYPFIEHNPNLTIMLAHWGGGLPFYALMPEVKKALKSVYFDSAASPFLYDPHIYTRVIEILGAEKVLFGTDYPLLDEKRALKELEDLKLKEADLELALSGNARRLLDIKGKR